MKKLFFAGLACMGSLLGNISSEEFSLLADKAIEAQSKAYTPYSKYNVGAAILTKSGKIYSGCNIENASYGLCNCAERTAIFKAVSDGEREFVAIIVATKDGGTPCGACRQVLNEFNPDMHVFTINENKEVTHSFTLEQILPHSFGPANLR